MKIFIRLNVLSLPFWQAIACDIFLQIQRNFQRSLNMQWTLFYANHSLDGTMDPSWSENAKR